MKLSSWLIGMIGAFWGSMALSQAVALKAALPAVEAPATDMAALKPVETILAGTYVTKGESYFYNSRFVIKDWASAYVMTAVEKYSAYAWDMEVIIEKQSGNIFSGTGRLYGRFSNGSVCSYPVTVEVRAYAEGLFVRELAPTTLPSTMTENGECREAGNASWYVHGGMYVKS